MKRQFLIAPIAILLACTGAAAFAAGGSGNDNSTFGAMDANSNGQVSQNEFNNYYSNSDVFGLWDANDDGWIGDDEFSDGLYDYYDDNGDGYIDDAEWEDGIMVDDYGDDGFWDM